MLARLLFVALVQLYLAFPTWAQESIQVFEDTTASLGIEDVIAMPEAFVKTTDTSIGFSDSAFWVRVELTNETNERQTKVVQFDSFSLPVIEAYNEVGSIAKSGYQIPQAKRPLSTFFPSFPVELQPNEKLIRYF